MTQQTNALRLADCIQPYNVATSIMLAQASAELRRLDAREDELLHHVCVLQGMNNESLESIKALTAENDQLKADYQRLMGKHNNLHINAKQCRTERDQLRAQVERLRGGEPMAFVHWPLSGPPKLVWHSNKALEDAIIKSHEGHQPDLLLYTAQPAAPSCPVKLTIGEAKKWRIVPIEPTTGMLIAGNHCQPGDYSAALVWKKMIEASDRASGELLGRPLLQDCDPAIQPAAPALVPWQPIEAAPNDGSDCWLLVGGEVHRGFWVEIEFEERRDIDGRYIDQTDADAYWMDHDSGDSLEPTMFYPITKPLPPAPVGIGQPAGGEG